MCATPVASSLLRLGVASLVSITAILVFVVASLLAVGATALFGDRFYIRDIVFLVIAVPGVCIYFPALIASFASPRFTHWVLDNLMRVLRRET